MSEKLTRQDCLIETIMVSNGNEDGLELQASAIVGDILGEAATDGSAVIVDCQRCDTQFAIKQPTRGSSPVIFRSENNCDRSAGTGLSVKAGEWALNLNVRNLRERGSVPY